MKISEVLSCSFSSWYTRFKDHTIKSQIIPLPDEFIDYLLADQIVLPEETISGDSGAQGHTDGDNRDEEDDIDWTAEDTPVAEAPSFPEFEEQLKQTIKRLGGQVFPKLNWSAPRDATWISFDRTLKCTCMSDVYLLLKSSDFITHDLTQPFDYCDDDENLKKETAVKYELVLRKWRELNPACEFRCFVKDKKVIGISQRYTDMYFSYIKESLNEIIADVQSFFYHLIRDTFPEKNFCFDIYRRSQGKLLLLDFNPFGAVTDGLLFTWDELNGDMLHQGVQPDQQVPIVRCIEVPTGIRPNPYRGYAMPTDLIDIASGEDPSKLMELIKIMVCTVSLDNGEKGMSLLRFTVYRKIKRTQLENNTLSDSESEDEGQGQTT